MDVASPRLVRYAVVATLPACPLGSLVSADIIYTEMNTSIYMDGTAFGVGGAQVVIEAYNYNYGSSSYLSTGWNYLDAVVIGGKIALGGGVTIGGQLPTAQGFAAGEVIGAGLIFGSIGLNWANLAGTYALYSTTVLSAGDWQNLFGETRLFLGIEIHGPAYASDVNYGWIDISWGGLAGATIHGYAYESDVNTAIVAGATESSGPVVPGAPTAVGLVGLAAGAAGIRRKRSA